MIKYAILAVVLAFLPGIQARAEPGMTPVGEWRVKDGSAHIRMFACDQKLWGILSWADKPGKDDNNPDPAKRGRSVLGLPILLDMQPEGEHKWSGRIYNADNGKIYDGSISLKSDILLRVEGCTLKILCGGEDWTRLKSETGEREDAICERIRKEG